MMTIKKKMTAKIHKPQTLIEYLQDLIEHYEDCRIDWLLNDPGDHEDPKGHIIYYEAHVKHVRKIIKGLKDD